MPQILSPVLHGKRHSKKSHRVKVSSVFCFNYLIKKQNNLKVTSEYKRTRPSFLLILCKFFTPAA